MGYILKQYNHIPGNGIDDIYDGDDPELEGMNDFLNPIPLTDSNVETRVYRAGGFRDSYVEYTVEDSGAPALQAGAHYYFHGAIKNGSTTIAGCYYNIKLVNKKSDDVNNDDERYQYIKSIYIAENKPLEDIEFIFTPIIDFTYILFEVDDKKMGQNPLPENTCLGVYELSLINNAMVTKLGLEDPSSKKIYPILKAGLQSRPGYLFCINGTDIRLPHSGIYEVKNGIIVVDFFSAITPFTKDVLRTQSDEYIVVWENINNDRRDIAFTTKFTVGNRRITGGFTIDYLYFVNDK